MDSKEHENDYRTYIASKQWQDRRWKKIRDDGSVMVRCEKCHGYFPVAMIQVHHLTYERLGREDNRDLQIFCRSCHKMEHGIDTTVSTSIATEVRVEEVQSSIKTGFANLDRATGGIQHGELVVLGSRPSIGKSALALCIARHVAVMQEIPVMVVTFEMDRAQLAIRAMSQQSGVPCTAIRSGTMDEVQIKQVQDAGDVISKSPLLVLDRPKLTVDNIIRTIEKYVDEMPIRLVVIDYVQMLKLPEREEFFVKKISRALRQIREASRSLQFGCVALTGLKRSVETRTDCIPTIQDFYGGGEIEHDADQVWALWRKSHYDNEESKDARLFVLWSRRAEPSSVNLVWTPETVTFSEPQLAEWSE